MVQRLRAELRRIVDNDGPAAQDAEIALSDGPIGQRLKSSILALTQHRGPESSICPSDAARAVGGEHWREQMDDARRLARELARSGKVEITQHGKVLDPDADWSGPIRLRIAGD